jgi:anhydro-N-acetylmuramic acid kinase
MNQKTLTLMGLMSGTSLDGLDIATVRFEADGAWEMLGFHCQPYSEHWRTQLAAARDLSGLELTRLDIDFGQYQAEAVKAVIQQTGILPDAVAAHGHTVFHQPDKGLTLQIGDGETMTALLGLPVITNFRMQDVALGGQGAPLVPPGEIALFPEYSLFLNLGGFANIHVKDFFACDVTVCNLALNYLAGKIGLAYDAEGKIAASGEIIPALLTRLNALSFFQQQAPKSLGIEWFLSDFLPILAAFDQYSEADQLCTLSHHIAFQISRLLEGKKGKMMVTGGGAWNLHLIQLLQEYMPEISILVPERNILEGKEALIFAWLGYRRLLGLPNTMKERTGGGADTSSGSLHGSVKWD